MEGSKACSFYSCLGLFVIMLMLTGLLAGCGGGAAKQDVADQGGGSSAQEAVVADEASSEDAAEEDALFDVSRANLVTGEGVGGTLPASPEALELANSIAVKLGVPIGESIEFGMGPSYPNEGTSGPKVIAVAFYKDNFICASAECLADGTLVSSMPYTDMATLAKQS